MSRRNGAQGRPAHASTAKDRKSAESRTAKVVELTFHFSSAYGRTGVLGMAARRLSAARLDVSAETRSHGKPGRHVVRPRHARMLRRRPWL
jgi:hypothetical protein